MALPNLSDNPLLSTSTYRSHHRLDTSLITPRVTNWASIIQNNPVDEIESLDTTECDSDDETTEHSKTYYKKLLTLKNKTILKKESNNDALRELFKGVVDHQERCQLLETSVKNIQQNEIELHESYVEDLEYKLSKLQKKHQKEKLDHDIRKSKLDEMSKENSKLKKQLVCVICHVSERNVLFLPCKHFACCKSCANTLYTNTCPTCRTTIDEKKVIYSS
tara:strand:- start:23610 stop:24269 length:660 start_codon:yes stop_codon:yes gene_type:complete